jgi:hypothetical protein
MYKVTQHIYKASYEDEQIHVEAHVQKVSKFENTRPTVPLDDADDIKAMSASLNSFQNRVH